MKIKNKLSLWAGIIIFMALIASYFMKIKADNGGNYVIEDSLLGALIFHNPFVLGIYILIGIILLFKGIK